MARLTIGMPVYNNAQTLRAALESLLAQTFTDLRIVISDDASTDNTADIAEQYAAKDSRVTVVRQPQNLGYSGNFGFLLSHAETPYFMWAAGDDRWGPDYAAANVAALDADPSLAASISRAEFMRGGERLGPSTGTYPIKGTVEDRLALLLSGWGNCDMSRLFAVYRTAMAKKALPLLDTFAFDLAFCSIVALDGGSHEVPEVMMWRDRTPNERYLAIMRREAGHGVERLFPGLRITRWLLREPRIPRTRAVLLALLAFNMEWHLAITAQYNPGYAALFAPVHRIWRNHLNWRCRRPLPG
ncbi:MAG TPA: glycosyltransferase family 2 protein [Alphaproteobacteria bacterium]|nr:glycosyltransferase family 2 protein [Alphaproteobacteria bacterium]